MSAAPAPAPHPLPDAIEQFRVAIAAAGLPPPDEIHADGKLRRFPTNEKRGDDAGWYVLYDDGIPSGAFGCWRSGISETWRTDVFRSLNATEETEIRARVERMRRERELDDARRKVEARAKAAQIWAAATPADDSHPYLQRKRVAPHGARIHDGKLVIPMHDETGALVGLQFIAPDGGKLFLSGTKLNGSSFQIGEIGDPIFICEGFASASTVYAATGGGVLVAFAAGNLLNIAKQIRIKHPGKRIVLCADNDKYTPANPGLKAAQAAAGEVEGTLLVPRFKDDSTKPTDFNDLVALDGIEEVRRQIETTIAARDVLETSCLSDGATIASAKAIIEELSKLDALAYEHRRKDAAREAGLRPHILDKLVQESRVNNQVKNISEIGDDPEPWSHPVDGALLLNEITNLFHKYVVLSHESAHALALWVILTYLCDEVHVLAIVVLSSPEMRCGKTRALSMLRRFVRRPLAASNVTAAVTFRAIEKWRPTLIIDEADTFFAENDELRGILNSGHTKDTAFVLRTTGDDFEPKRFSTWGAKAIALIGAAPATIIDRAIVIPLRRKRADENVERLRLKVDFPDIRMRCMRWANDVRAAMRHLEIAPLDQLSDRASDNWEPLRAIARLAGGNWPEHAKAAALSLSSDGDEVASWRVLLLSDVREIFTRRGADRLTSATIVEELAMLEDRPWPESARGKPINVRQLATLLRPFKISPQNIKQPDGRVPKGYLLDSFSDAFERYLSVTSILSATPLPQLKTSSFCENLSATEESLVADEKFKNSLNLQAGSAVAAENPESGEAEQF